LIQYLLDKSEKRNYTYYRRFVNVPSRKENKQSSQCNSIALDIFNEAQRTGNSKADIVISMLPAHLHIEVARDCVVYKKSLVTASYVSEAMQELDELLRKTILFS
jgi:saccharopine dehydrogenase-like NADP-dependent oxidoreductase